MDLDDALDELYAAAPEDFVAERSRLAKALKQAGRGEDAAALAKVRKPPLAAWALNQLARRNRRDVDLLLDAGNRLREAQAGVLGGADREPFERARAAERDAVARLTRDAETLLAERGGGSPAVLAQVGDSLRTAAISPEGRELLARGRFATPLASEGFDLVGELAASAPKRKRPDGREERARATEALREAKARLREAEAAARDARTAAARLEAEATAARRASDAAEAAAGSAAREVADAEERLRGLRR